MRDDIIGGLRNAVEHGSSVEQAIQSFVNAGYKESEVREAARFLDTSISSIMQTRLQTSLSPIPMQAAIPVTVMPRPAPQTPAISQIQQAQQMQPMRMQGMQGQQTRPAYFEVRSGFRPNWIIIILSAILILSVVAFVASLLFKQQIADYLSTRL